MTNDGLTYLMTANDVVGKYDGDTTWIGAGSDTCEPRTAVVRSATRIWPSTPMLKRVILKPNATAAAEIMSGVARLRVDWMTLVSPRAPNKVE